MERRSHLRIEMNTQASFLGEGTSDVGRVEDLSGSGCKFKSKNEFRVGNFIALDLQLPDRKGMIQVDVAVVRWVNGNRIGLDFLQIQPDQEQRLRNYINTPGWIKSLKKLLPA